MNSDDSEIKVVPPAGHSLPEPSTVLRYIGGSHIDNGQVNGGGFHRKPKEANPSINWLGWFDPPEETQVDGVRGLSRLKYGASALLVTLDVAKTKMHVSQQRRGHVQLNFVHDPKAAEGVHRADPSHALIMGIPNSDDAEAALVCDLLAECIEKTYPAKGQS